MNARNVYKCEEEVKIVLLEMARRRDCQSSLSPPVMIFVNSHAEGASSPTEDTVLLRLVAPR